MLVVNGLLILALLGAGADAFSGMRALPVAGLRRSAGVASNPLLVNVAARQLHPSYKRDLAIRSTTNELVGEDAATFSLGEQEWKAWGTFLVAVSGVLGVLFYTWLYEGGPHWGDQFKDLMESLAGGDTTLAITYMLGVFAVAHSGMASLRPKAEEIIGARPWRYVFALVSLPLAFSCIVYFINHRYDGLQLWDLRGSPYMHDFVWWSSLVSFLFLYPSTFNLLEVAAVEKPELHLWETGIARITRHPQMVGQLVWCAAHTAYMGTSFTCATSAMLCGETPTPHTYTPALCCLLSAVPSAPYAYFLPPTFCTPCLQPCPQQFP
jgi:hypothetical protein